jgi:hypothetical protein
MFALDRFLGSRLRMFSSAASLVLAVVVSQSAHAANPSVSSVTPVGGKRGTEVEVQIGGQNLGDKPEVMLYYPGITVKKVELIVDKAGKAADNNFKAVLAIAPDCRLGAHAIRVRTASGLTIMPVLFSVGALDEVAEKEPNSEFATPQEVPLDITVTGNIGGEDVDYFVVTAKKGERISAEVEGMRLGKNFDSYLAILDADRFELSRNDDDALMWYDSVASTIAPADGKYIIMLRESTYGSGPAYRLHIGRFPRPLAVLPAGGKPGQTLEVTYLGDVAGPRKEKITLPANPEFLSTIYAPDEKATALFPKDASGIAPSPVVFRTSSLDNVLEVEPNDDNKTQGTPFTAPMALNGVISKPGDVDCFAFKGTKGQVFDVRVHARSIRSPLDSTLTIYRLSNGGAIGNNDDSGSSDSYLRINLPADDTYVVQVKDMLDQGGDNYVYRVELAPVEPRLVLTEVEKIQYFNVAMPVPQGNRGAMMVNVQRVNFGGDIAVEARDMPKGMKFETIPIPANMSMFPVLFHADAAASPAVTAADLVAKTTDPKGPQVEGRFVQKSQLVRGNNNREVFTQTIRRLTTAVTEKAPFEIEIVEPKVPLVQNGSMELKVRVKRAPDFKAPISIRMLYNPPGTASSGSAQIEEGKDEGVLPLTAGSNAETKDWPIIVLATANVVNGPVEVASKFAKLSVGKAFFDFAFKPSAVEQGQELTFVVPVTNNVEFDGKATVELLGLPAEATAEKIEITKSSEDASFTVKTTVKTPAGRHKSVMCKLVVTQNGEPIVHTLGPGEIRVDAPLPPKPTAAAAKPAVAAAPKPVAVAQAKPAAAAKPLSRLEMLRKQKAEEAANK